MATSSSSSNSEKYEIILRAYKAFRDHMAEKPAGNWVEGLTYLDSDVKIERLAALHAASTPDNSWAVMLKLAKGQTVTVAELNSLRHPVTYDQQGTYLDLIIRDGVVVGRYNGCAYGAKGLKRRMGDYRRESYYMKWAGVKYGHYGPQGWALDHNGVVHNEHMFVVTTIFADDASLCEYEVKLAETVNNGITNCYSMEQFNAKMTIAVGNGVDFSSAGSVARLNNSYGLDQDFFDHAQTIRGGQNSLAARKAKGPEFEREHQAMAGRASASSSMQRHGLTSIEMHNRDRSPEKKASDAAASSSFNKARAVASNAQKFDDLFGDGVMVRLCKTAAAGYQISWGNAQEKGKQKFGFTFRADETNPPSAGEMVKVRLRKRANAVSTLSKEGVYRYYDLIIVHDGTTYLHSPLRVRTQPTPKIKEIIDAKEALDQ